MENKKTQFVAKKQNIQKNMILKELYIRGSLSGSEISKKIKLSFPTVIRFIGELMDAKLVVDKGIGESIGGRRPGLYGINPETGFVLAIDVRRDIIRMALLNMENKLIGKEVDFTITEISEEQSVKQILLNGEKLLRSNNIDREKLLAIGVSLTGLINRDTGKNLSFLNVGQQSLQEVLEGHFKVPAFMENDAAASAMGELAFGQAHSYESALIINVGWGIGMGMILNGKLYKGKSGFCGEFGHVAIEGAKELCYCGKKGCLETQASGEAIIKEAQRLIKEGEPTRLLDYTGGKIDKISTVAIVEAALNGDQFSIELVQKIGKLIGKALVSVLHILNPEIVILGGTISQAGNLLMDTIKQSVRKDAILEIAEDTDLRISDLGNLASLRGAYAIVMEKLFDESETEISLL